MSWAKFDDRYDDNPKVKAVWRSNRAAVGLHAMAITYSSRHETDGLIDVAWLAEKLPSKREREKVADDLVMAGLFEPIGDGRFLVHDYLEFNPSRADAEAKRLKKAEAGKKGAAARWHTDDTTHGKSHSNGHGTTHGKSEASRNAPVPTRIDEEKR